MRNIDKRQGLILLGLLIMCRGDCWALDLAGFRACLRVSGTAPACALDPGEYVIDSPVQVERSGITITGIAAPDGSLPVLRRAPGYRQELLRFWPGRPELRLSSITLARLLIDGNRMRAGLTATEATADVGVNSTTNLLIRDCVFVNAPLHHVVLDARTSAVMITDSRFTGAAWFGVWSDNRPALPRPGESPECVKPPDLLMMRDMVVAGNVFERAGANALFLRADNLQVIGNVFRDNHAEAPFGISGGQVDIINCSDNVAFYRNRFTDGRRTENGWWADGFEIYSSNVSLVDNTVENHAGAAGTFLGVEDVFIAHWDPRHAFRRNRGGPFIANSQGYRTVSRVHIDRMISVDSTEHYGVNFDNAQTGVPLRGIVLTNNCLARNREPTFLRGLGSDAVVLDNREAECGPADGEPEPYRLPAPRIFEQTVELAGAGAPLRVRTSRAGNWATLVRSAATPAGLTATLRIDTTGLTDGIYTAELLDDRGTSRAVDVEVGHGGPLFTAESVLNAATLHASGVSPGMQVHIYGRGFGPPFPYEGLVSEGLLRTRLAATRVLVNGVPAPVVYTAANEVVVTMPVSISGAAFASLQVEDLGAVSPAVRIPVVAAAPGLFRDVRSADGRVLGPDEPASPGEVVSLRATGLGLFDSDAVSGTPVLPVSIHVGERRADLLRVSRSTPINSGIVQLDIMLPEILDENSREITLQVGDFRSATIALPVR